jgi:hypothetical protein
MRSLIRKSALISSAFLGNIKSKAIFEALCSAELIKSRSGLVALIGDFYLANGCRAPRGAACDASLGAALAQEFEELDGLQPLYLGILKLLPQIYPKFHFSTFRLLLLFEQPAAFFDWLDSLKGNNNQFLFLYAQQIRHSQIAPLKEEFQRISAEWISLLNSQEECATLRRLLLQFVGDSQQKALRLDESGTFVSYEESRSRAKLKIGVQLAHQRLEHKFDAQMRRLSTLAVLVVGSAVLSRRIPAPAAKLGASGHSHGPARAERGGGAASRRRSIAQCGPLGMQTGRSCVW